MGVVLTTEVPTLDGTGEAFTFGLTGYVYQLACSEEFSFDQIASLEIAFFKTELPTPRPAATLALAKGLPERQSHAKHDARRQ